MGGFGGCVLPANDTCASPTAEDLSDGTHTVVDGSTICAIDDYQSYCADTTTAKDAPDVVYQLNVKDPGTLTISLDDAVDTEHELE